MANQILIDQLITAYKAFKAVSTDNFFRTNIGTLSLEHLRPKLVDFANRVDKTINHLNQLSDQTIKLILNNVRQLDQIIKTTTTYDDNNFIQQRVATENQFNAIYEQSFNWWTQAAAIISLNLSDLQREQLIEETKKLTEELKEKSEASAQYAKEIEDVKLKLNEQLKSLESKYKEISPKGELLTQLQFFNTEADTNKKHSWFWMSIIIVVGIVIFYTFYCLFKDFCFEMKCLEPAQIEKYNAGCKDCGKTLFYFEIFKAASYRILIVSLLIYILTFCIKNFNASRHNYTINKHKSNSFSAAIALYDKMSASGRDTLMLHAAQAIFTHQLTGYIGKDTEPANPSFVDKLVDKIK